MSHYSTIYVFGAGSLARRLISIIQKQTSNYLQHKELYGGGGVEAVLVTSISANPESISDISVKQIYDINESKRNTAGVILAIREQNINEVLSLLKTAGYSNFLVIEDIIAITNNQESACRRPLMEITTNIGCSIQCKFCPQKVLLTNYYGFNKQRKSRLAFDDFKTCIDKMPDNTLISFTGFSEPFLNDECVPMIQYANQQGFSLILSTTLVGLTETSFEQIKDIPFYTVILHAPDNKGYAKINESENYYKVLNRCLNHTKANGLPFIDFANGQAEPTERFKKFTKDKLIVDYGHLNDRAGNIKDNADNICKSISNIEGDIYCCSSYDLNHWVLLPDGTVTICCMDFSLSNALGNLLEQDYQTIMDSDKHRMLVNALRCGGQSICRSCVNARLKSESIFMKGETI